MKTDKERLDAIENLKLTIRSCPLDGADWWEANPASDAAHGGNGHTVREAIDRAIDKDPIIGISTEGAFETLFKPETFNFKTLSYTFVPHSNTGVMDFTEIPLERTGTLIQKIGDNFVNIYDEVKIEPISEYSYSFFNYPNIEPKTISEEELKRATHCARGSSACNFRNKYYTYNGEIVDKNVRFDTIATAEFTGGWVEFLREK